MAPSSEDRKCQVWNRVLFITNGLGTGSTLTPTKLCLKIPQVTKTLEQIQKMNLGYQGLTICVICKFYL